MLLRNLRVRESSLFTYVIGSADMRYSAVNERTLYLRNDPDFGPLLRGEITNLGPECNASFSQVLLEHALSCDACHDVEMASELIECAAERLGRILATKLYQTATNIPLMDQVIGAFDFMLRSMGFEATMQKTPDGIRYDLGSCPIVETAQATGLMSGVAMARHSFISICASILRTLAPAWTMEHPTVDDHNEPLEKIILTY